MAQEDERLTIPPDDKLAMTANRFTPRPKFFVMEVEAFDGFRVDAISNIMGEETAIVRENLIRNIKLKFPLILKDNYNLIGGIGYRHEQFKFEEQSDPEFPFFAQFEDKSLKQISANFYYKQDLSSDKFLYVFLRSSMNSDIPAFEGFGDQLKLSITTVYGKNIGPHKIMGYGISFGYDFGQPAVYPLFILNNNFTQHWGYELLLPKKVQIRYSPDQSNHFYAAVDVQGASYHLRERVFENFSDLEFRRSSVRTFITYEREIHDWLWMGITGGYRIPINIFLSEPGERRSDAIVKIEANAALYGKFSIFFVPPNKLYNRAKGR